METTTQYRRRLDTLLEGIQIIDFDWRYVYVNNVMAEQAKASKEELLGRTMMEKYPGIENTEVFKIIERCMKTRAAQRFENCFRYPDGSLQWFDLRIEPDDQGICILSIDITDYKQTQQRVIANEKKFRALIEKAADIKTMATAEGKLLYGSPSMAKVLGYSLEEMGGKVVFELFHPEDIDEFLRNRQKILKKPGDTFNFQLRVRHKNGHWVWCDGTVTNLLEEAGINAMVSNFTDISEQKKAEQQREFDRNNLDALINNSTDLMWSVDRNFNLITSNTPYNATFKTARGVEIAKGDNILKATPPIIRLWLIENYKRAFLGEIFTETVFNPIDGRWLEVSFHPIRKGGMVVGAACHSRDITSQKKLEENLKLTIREISDYKYALDQSSIVSITDQRGVITHVNENFCKISKYGCDELIGKDHRIINSGYHPKAFFKKLWAIIERGETWRGELRNRTKDGSVYWVDATIVPFLDETGKPYQYIAIRSDITARKAAEEELVHNNLALQKTNLELDRFVYSISHDLRAPLTSILGLLSLIEDETREDETRQHTQMIRSGVYRLDTFIKNILSYSRNNRTGLAVEEVELEQTAREVIASARGMSEASGIDFIVDFKTKSPVYTDKQSLLTILENLVSNAIKFHRKDIPNRFIRVSGVGRKKSLVIEISDNGTGIAAEHHAKIFDMFFRLSGKIDGSGIGLYIVSEIVKKLGGTIDITSREGLGTTFRITLKNFGP